MESMELEANWFAAVAWDNEELEELKWNGSSSTTVEEFGGGVK